MALAVRACRELGIELHDCSTAKSAMEKFTLERFHGVIVDDQDGPSAALLLKDLRASANGKKSVIIALAKRMRVSTPSLVLEPILSSTSHSRTKNCETGYGRSAR
ncbi:MAG: hypothetical protein WBW53_01350 [Terriglobales bacterium]